MNITFYYNNSDDNELKKILTFKLDLSGNLREGTSIITPTIIIQVSDNDYLKVIESNYVHIQDFKRYYFITDIVCAAKNLWDISMKVDVLMSFKNDILNLPVILERNEYKYNKYLTDNLLPITNKLEIIYSNRDYTGHNMIYETEADCFSTTNERKYDGDTHIANPYGDYALGYYNGDGVYVITVLANATSGLTNVDNNNVTNNSFEGTYILDANSFKEFCQRFNGISWKDVGSWFGIEKYNEYLLSIHYYPINITRTSWWSSGKMKQIPFGKTSTITLTEENNYVYVPYYSDNVIAIGTFLVSCYYKYPRYSEDFFLNLKPYSIYEVYIPYYGFYELDMSKIIGLGRDDDQTFSFYIKYYLDYRVGKLLIKIRYESLPNDYKSIPFEYEEFIDVVDFGFEIPIGSTNFTATITNITHQMTMNGINRAVSSGGLAIGALAAVATGGASAVVVGGAAAAGEANTLNNTRTDLRTSIQGSGNPSLPGRLNLLTKNKLFIRITSKIPDRPIYHYNHNYGLPTNASGTLKTFSGFTKVASTHIENIKYATDSERRLIMDKLTSGIIL